MTGNSLSLMSLITNFNHLSLIVDYVNILILKLKNFNLCAGSIIPSNLVLLNFNKDLFPIQNPHNAQPEQ